MEGIIGVLIGSIITSLIFLFERKDKLKLAAQDRKDKFRLAAIDKRLEAHQKAYSYCTKILKLMDSNDENDIRSLFLQGQDLLSDYALYLGDGTRTKLVEVLGVLNAYYPRKKFINSFTLEKRNEAYEIYKRETKKIFDLSKVIQKEVALEPINLEVFKT